MRYLWVALASISLNVVANVAFVKALEVSDLSLSVPLLSLTPAAATGFAVILLGEHLSMGQSVGILLVVIGALVLTTEHSADRSVLGWINAVRRDRGSLFMLLVAVCWSLTLPFDKIAVLIVGPSHHALISTAGVALATLIVLLSRGRRREALTIPRRTWPLLLASILVSAFAFGIQLVLLEKLQVGVIDGTKRALGNVMALVFGAMVYRESVTVIKAVSLTLMGCGVFLILN